MEEEAEKRKRLAPIQKGNGEDEKKEEGGEEEKSKGESTATSAKAARRPKRDR